jgi:hypothetical protein
VEDYALYLAEEARSDIAALHQFRILYDSLQSAFHFFFEGEEDSLFYMPEARRIASRSTFNIYDCGGKRNVVSVRESLKSEGYSLEKCLFFVDRDFDDYLNTQVDVDENTYITDNYSIESDIASIDSARILLVDLVRISRADPEFARLESSLTEAFSTFYKVVRPLTAWILAAKESGCAPNLRNIVGLKGVVTLSGMQPAITSAGFALFKRRVINAGRAPAISAVVRWYRCLDMTNCKLWVRGKYDLWFFQVALLASLEVTSSRRRSSGGRAVPVPAGLRDGRIFEILGGRVQPPASLQDFYAAKLR